MGDDISAVKLIAKAGLLKLYTKVGFVVDGLSPIIHGSDPWFDCTYVKKFSVPYSVVDAFADAPYGGNPAGVVLLREEEELTSDEMVIIASENNLSETAFARFPKSKGGPISLKWFSPTVEVHLCGHGTLATAHAIYNSCDNYFKREGSLVFETKSGQLVAKKISDNRIQLEFPLIQATDAEDVDKTLLQESLGGVNNWTRILRTDNNLLMIIFESPETILSISPVFAQILKLETRILMVRSLVDRFGGSG